MRAPIAARFDCVPTSLMAIQWFAEAGILVQGVEVGVLRIEAAELLEDILITIVVDIGEGDRVALGEVAKATCVGDVCEALSADAPVHHVRQQSLVARIAGAEEVVEGSRRCRDRRSWSPRQRCLADTVLHCHLAEAALGRRRDRGGESWWYELRPSRLPPPGRRAAPGARPGPRSCSPASRARRRYRRPRTTSRIRTSGLQPRLRAPRR